jgi:hypothetical protein
MEIEDEDWEITDEEAEHEATKDVAILDDLLMSGSVSASGGYRAAFVARVNLLRTTGHSAIFLIRFCAYIGALISIE